MQGTSYLVSVEQNWHFFVNRWIGARRVFWTAKIWSFCTVQFLRMRLFQNAHVSSTDIEVPVGSISRISFLVFMMRSASSIRFFMDVNSDRVQFKPSWIFKALWSCKKKYICDYLWGPHLWLSIEHIPFLCIRNDSLACIHVATLADLTIDLFVSFKEMRIWPFFPAYIILATCHIFLAHPGTRKCGWPYFNLYMAIRS